MTDNRFNGSFLVDTLYDPKEENGHQPQRNQKKCPFCAELILYEAIKCRHCHEFLDTSASPSPPTSPGTPAAESSKKWHQSNGAILLALLTLGPLALQIVWLNRRYSLLAKIIITVIVIVITGLLLYGIYQIYSRLVSQIKAMGL